MTPNPQQALILDSGCEAQPVNPFNREFCENRQVSCLSSDVCECQKADDFAKANPPLSTTKEYKHLAGKVVPCKEVWQIQLASGEWSTVGWEPLVNNGPYRRAFEVLSEEESKPPYSVSPELADATNKMVADMLNENSVEEAAEKWIDNHDALVEKLANNYMIRDFSKHLIAELKSRNKQCDYDAIEFITDDYIQAGASYIINFGEYVKLDDVCDVLDSVAKNFPNEEWMIAYKNDVICELERLTTLKNKQ